MPGRWSTVSLFQHTLHKTSGFFVCLLFILNKKYSSFDFAGMSVAALHWHEFYLPFTFLPPRTLQLCWSSGEEPVTIHCLPLLVILPTRCSLWSLTASFCMLFLSLSPCNCITLGWKLVRSYKRRRFHQFRPWIGNPKGQPREGGKWCWIFRNKWSSVRLNIELMPHYGARSCCAAARSFFWEWYKTKGLTICGHEGSPGILCKSKCISAGFLTKQQHW